MVGDGQRGDGRAAGGLVMVSRRRVRRPRGQWETGAGGRSMCRAGARTRTGRRGQCGAADTFRVHFSGRGLLAHVWVRTLFDSPDTRVSPPPGRTPEQAFRPGRTQHY
eukprot:5926474-Prymnesium_polylepis.1